MSPHAIEIEALTALPRIDASRSTLASAIAALLRAEALDVRVDADAAGPGWFACPDEIAFRPLAADATLADDRVDAAVALLDALDPLIARIETALGVSLDPHAILAAPPQSALALTVTADGRAIVLAVPVAHPHGETWRERAMSVTAPAASLPCLCSILLDGPRLSIAEANDLSGGDLLLLAARHPAHIVCAGHPGASGTFDFGTQSFAAHAHDAQEDLTMADADTPAEFLVPLSIRLPDRMTSAASLAALVPGTTLPLGPIVEGMPVTLLVAGRTLAQGELVQIGDRFAVLIEERPALDDVVAAPTDEVAA